MMHYVVTSNNMYHYTYDFNGDKKVVNEYSILGVFTDFTKALQTVKDNYEYMYGGRIQDMDGDHDEYISYTIAQYEDENEIGKVVLCCNPVYDYYNRTFTLLRPTILKRSTWWRDRQDMLSLTIQ